MVSCTTAGAGVGYSMDRLGSACMGSVWACLAVTEEAADH